MSEVQPQQQREPNTVFIGKKPTMAYVLACLTVMQNGTNTVNIKARGKAISKAVDVAQIMTKRFATDVSVKKIAINTEQVKSMETGAMNNVSSIEIRLEK
jgi:DNA-binding protein